VFFEILLDRFYASCLLAMGLGLWRGSGWQGCHYVLLKSALVGAVSDSPWGHLYGGDPVR